MNVVGRVDGTARATPAASRLVLDISRLLSRAGAAVPTGIDRVELAWAEHLLASEAHRLDFAAIHPLGATGRLPFVAARDFVEALSRSWGMGRAEERVAVRAGRLLHGLLLPARTRRDAGGAATYLLMSHQNLHRPRVMQDALGRHRARLVAMIHDLIPLDYPEYCGARQPERHRLRVDTVAQLARAVIVPSGAVRDGLALHFAARRAAIPVHVVPNGVHLPAVAASLPRHGHGHGHGHGQTEGEAAPPYFVCLGTIEPRKNHALLLAVWRQLATTLGGGAPRLVLIGRRGWECEHVHRLIDRTPGLQALITEHNNLPDADVVQLLRGAQALLYPSFAEGFGLPVAEALALGVPVICSDIPVHREVGGTKAWFIDPTDGPAWSAAVLELARRDRATLPAPMQGRGREHGVLWPERLRSAVTMIDATVAR